MKPIILFRKGFSDDEELEAAKQHFDVVESRCAIPKDSLVIGRYSVLPYYKELQNDVEYLGGSMLTSFRSHNYIADMRNWYMDLQGHTPKTWFSLAEVPRDRGPYVLKGATNSKKQQWKTHMFAETWEDASRVEGILRRDGLLGSQDIYIRRFVPLRSFGNSIGGMPITEEYRFFFYKTTELASGFYWSEHYETAEEHGLNPDLVPRDWLNDMTATVADHVDFFVIDVARTESGRWIVIELNDAQMSGLSMCNPKHLYSNLQLALSKENV